MPAKKYTCEYCDRTFNYSLDMRKKHFESRSHLLQVKLYYEALREHQPQPYCPSLLQKGYCELGAQRCTYSHNQPAISISNPLQWVRVGKREYNKQEATIDTLSVPSVVACLPPSLQKTKPQKNTADGNDESGWGW